MISYPEIKGIFKPLYFQVKVANFKKEILFVKIHNEMACQFPTKFKK
jgi:hypothetical protein